MGVRWNEDLLSQVRERAAAGRSMRQAAADLHVPLTSLARNASDHKIKFHGRHFIPPADRPMAGARQELGHQIRLALAAAAVVPLYRGWSDGSGVWRRDVEAALVPVADWLP
jgi:hypothetical protein